MLPPIARYREFDPCPALREYVRCFFTFTTIVTTAPESELCKPSRAVRRERLFHAPGSYTTPLFADSHVSLSFSFGRGYRVDGLWNQAEQRHCGHVIGPVRTAHAADHGERIVEVGVYFRAARAKSFFAAAATHDLTDRIVPLSDLWGSGAASLEADIAEAGNDAQRVDRLERALLERFRACSGSTIDLAAVANFVRQKRGNISVEELADHTGVSRQHLGRLFRDEVGVSPKLFCRLARFRAALAAGRTGGADLAAEFGYVDQSHMIAEFQEFSGLTPRPLLLQQRLHPFSD